MTQAKSKWLVFVDTHILLEFYRLLAIAVRQLEALERHKAACERRDLPSPADDRLALVLLRADGPSSVSPI